MLIILINYPQTVYKLDNYSDSNKTMIEHHALSPDLRREISQHQKQYLKLSQIAYYSDLQKMEKLKIFTKSSCDVQCNIIFCFDSRLYNSDIKQEIELYVLRTLNEEIPKLKNKFSIIYIHDNIKAFIFFRNVLRILPESILTKLETIYLVEAGIIVKILQKLSFGAFNNFFEEKIEYTERLEDIERKNKITLGGGLTKSKILMKEEDKKGNLDLETQNLLPNTEVIKNGFYGKQIHEYQLGQFKLPAILELLIGRLYSQTYFLQKEGIMRKSCDVEELQILENHILQNHNIQEYIMNEKDPYVIGGCAKKIFNNLELPLFSYQIYGKIISYRSDAIKENDIEFVRKCISMMKQPNRNVLAYMTAFLVKGIAFYAQINKMNSYNLSVVFGPCFFRPEQYKLEDLMSSGKFSFIVKLILDNYQAVFGEETAHKYFTILETQREQMKNYK